MIQAHPMKGKRHFESLANRESKSSSLPVITTLASSHRARVSVTGRTAIKPADGRNIGADKRSGQAAHCRNRAGSPTQPSGGSDQRSGNPPQPSAWSHQDRSLPEQPSSHSRPQSDPARQGSGHLRQRSDDPHQPSNHLIQASSHSAQYSEYPNQQSGDSEQHSDRSRHRSNHLKTSRFRKLPHISGKN